MSEDKIILQPEIKAPDHALTMEEIKEAGLSDPIRVVHTLCGAICFWHDGVPQEAYGVIDPRKVLLPNGARAKDGDPIVCKFCGYRVQPNQLEWVIRDG